MQITGGVKGGTWIAKHYAPEHGRRYKALGTSDDIDGTHILSFSHTREAARRWLRDLGREDAGKVETGPDSVSNALDDHVADYKRRGGKALARLE